MLTLVRRILFAITSIVLAVLLLGPWAIYEAGLANIVVLPTPPSTTPVSVADAKAIWSEFKEPGSMTVEPLSPYGYALALFTDLPLPPGAHVAWFVARNHNSENLKNRRMIWWHTSGAALTIWLTRNWSTEQLTAKAYEITHASQPASNPALKPTTNGEAVGAGLAPR